jgi:hypothetical protein
MGRTIGMMMDGEDDGEDDREDVWMYCRTIWGIERMKTVMMAIYEIYESEFETGVKYGIFSSMVFCASRLLP